MRQIKKTIHHEVRIEIHALGIFVPVFFYG